MAQGFMSTGCRLPKDHMAAHNQRVRRVSCTPLLAFESSRHSCGPKKYPYIQVQILNIRGSIKPSAFPLSQKVHWSWTWKLRGKGLLLLNPEDWLGVCDNGWAGNLFHMEGKTQTHKRNEYKVSETWKDSQNGKTLHVSPGNIVPKAKVSVLIISVCFVLHILGSSGKAKKKKKA